MTCPVCKAPSVGTKPCPGYCEGVEDGREDVWRALLERDIAEVERYAIELRDEVASALADLKAAWPGREDDRAVRAVLRRRLQAWEGELADCESWLVRARAALEGVR